MNKRFLLTGLLGCCLLSAIAQQSPVLLSFSNGKKVTKSEFEYVYQRNNGGLDSAKKHSPAKYKEYLDLYIRYRRKVMDAEAAGLDTLQSFKDEFNGYVKQLSQPYLIEKEVLDQLIKEAYERSKSEIHAAHLLVNCSQDAKPEDTLAAYNKAIAFRDSVLKGGKSFAYMAEKYSDDPSARQNKGDLGYFTVFDFVYPFESGAYQTPVGQISMPVRSQFGYHLINVMEKVPAQGTKRVSHIMVRIGENYSAKDTASAVARINEIYEKLKNGADFAKLAETMSDDPISAKKGGDLGNGFLLYELQMQKHALSVGQFSRPFASPYGWHILKVTEVNPIKPFEQAKNELKQKVSKDSRAKISEQKLLERLKKDYKFSLNQANINKLISQLDNSYLNPGYGGDSLREEIKNLVLFSFGKTGEEKGTVKELIAFNLNSRRAPARGELSQIVTKEIQQFADRRLLDYEQKQLSDKYPEFRELVREYRDGILLFSMMEQKAWRKAVEDSAGLKSFYEANKQKFQSKERAAVKEYRCTDSTVISSLRQLIESQKPEAEIDSFLNKKGQAAVRISNQSYEIGSGKIADELFKQKVGYLSTIKKEGNLFTFQQLIEFRPAGPKTFEEAKSECITLYQNKLEDDWHKELEAKYPVKIDEKVLKTLYR